MPAANVPKQAFFRGEPQHHMIPAAMNQIQRDTVRNLLPAFKTSGYEDEGDMNPYTDHLKPGAYLDKKLKGYTVPTFDNLICGLRCLPSGRDVRGLTQCLAWYLSICSTFTPRLELNVLHTQALFRALRQPSEPVGTQNSDKIALQEWQDQGTFKKVEVTVTKQDYRKKVSEEYHTGHQSMSQAVFSIHQDSVNLKMHVHVPIRHIMTFPFLALHGVVGQAFKLGIDRAERQNAARRLSKTPVQHASKEQVKREVGLQKTPKRCRQAETDAMLAPT